MTIVSLSASIIVALSKAFKIAKTSIASTFGIEPLNSNNKSFNVWVLDFNFKFPSEIYNKSEYSKYKSSANIFTFIFSKSDISNDAIPKTS